jgi:hypothetical protein
MSGDTIQRTSELECDVRSAEALTGAPEREAGRAMCAVVLIGEDLLLALPSGLDLSRTELEGEVVVEGRRSNEASARAPR